MNKAQYSIVKYFQKMGAKPVALAKAFKADLCDIRLAYASRNFDQFNQGYDPTLVILIRGLF